MKQISLKTLLLIFLCHHTEINAREPTTLHMTAPTLNQIYINTFKYGHLIEFKDIHRTHIIPHNNQCNEDSSKKSIAAYSVGFFFEKKYTQSRPMSRVQDLVTKIDYPSCNNVKLDTKNYIDLENYNIYIKYDKLPENLWFKFEMNIQRHRSNETIRRWYFDMYAFGDEYSNYFLEAFPGYGASHVMIYKKGCQDVTREDYEKLKSVFSSVSVLYENPQTGNIYQPNQKKTVRAEHGIIVTKNDLKESHVFGEGYYTDLLLNCYRPN